jgi:hypothetical protein
MKIRKIISKAVDESRDGVSTVGGVNAVVSANVGEPGGRTVSRVSSRQRVVQRQGRTTRIEEHHVDTDPEGSQDS